MTGKGADLAKTATPTLSSRGGADAFSGTKTLAEQAYVQLRADIQSGALLPGAKLSTTAMKLRFGLSLSTVREALTRLVGDTLVTIEGQRGFRVAPVSLSDLRDLIALRKLVEGEALARSMVRGDDGWEGGIVRAFHELERIESRLSAAVASQYDADITELSAIWEERNARFHMSLIAACESPRLVKLYGELYDQTARYRQVSFQHRGQVLQSIDDEHRAIFEAVMARDVCAAQAAAGRHLESIFGYFEP